MDKKLHIIVLSYQRIIPLRIVIDCFICQTYPHWRMTIVHDGKASDELKDLVNSYKYDSRISFIETDTLNGDFGFPNRKMMLEKADPADGEYLLFCADDSYYVPRFVEYMLSATSNDVGIVYCDMVHSHIGHDILKGDLKINHIDMGAFIVRVDLAKRTGFNFTKDNVYYADGLFAEECYAEGQRTGLRSKYIPKPLFCHN